MLLAALVLAALPCQEPAGTASKSDGAAKVWENLDVMQRLLQRRISEKADAICRVAPTKEADATDADEKSERPRHIAGGTNPLGNSGGEPNAGLASPTVLGDLFASRNAFATGTAIAADAEYVPGLAAIFSLTVPVRARMTRIEPKAAESGKASETKSADDEAWDELAQNDATVHALTGANRYLAKNGDERRVEVRYDPAAVKALSDTLVDAVARFGSRLGLAHGERIAVVVRLAAGQVIAPSGTETSDEPRTAKSVDDRESVALDQYATANRGGVTWYLNGSVQPAGRRLVLQVSADDVRAYKNGELDRAALMKCFRIEEFAAPSANSPATIFQDGSWRGQKR